MSHLIHKVIDDRGNDLDGNQPVTDARAELVSVLGEERLRYFAKRFAEAVNIPENEFYRRSCSETVE